VKNSSSQHTLVGITSWGYGCAEVNPNKHFSVQAWFLLVLV